MIFAALFGSLLPAHPGLRRPLRRELAGRRSAQYLFIHSLQGTRHFLGDVFQLEALNHLFELWQGTAIAASNRLAERECLANHLEIGAAGAAILEAGSGFCAALRAIHN